jgi:hypothetical protein
VVSMLSRRRLVKTDRPPAESDEELVLRAQTDRVVFALLYDRYVDPVCHRPASRTLAEPQGRGEAWRNRFGATQSLYEKAG